MVIFSGAICNVKRFCGKKKQLLHISWRIMSPRRRMQKEHGLIFTPGSQGLIQLRLSGAMAWNQAADSLWRFSLWSPAFQGVSCPTNARKNSNTNMSGGDCMTPAWNVVCRLLSGEKRKKFYLRNARGGKREYWSVSAKKACAHSHSRVSSTSCSCSENWQAKKSGAPSWCK